MKKTALIISAAVLFQLTVKAQETTKAPAHVPAANQKIGDPKPEAAKAAVVLGAQSPAKPIVAPVAVKDDEKITDTRTISPLKPGDMANRITPVSTQSTLPDVKITGPVKNKTILEMDAAAKKVQNAKPAADTETNSPAPKQQVPGQ